MSCSFCDQEHAPVELAKGSLLGFPVATCPNLPKNWVLVKGTGEPIIVVLPGEQS
jgi:hypothetical protein